MRSSRRLAVLAAVVGALFVVPIVPVASAPSTTHTRTESGDYATAVLGDPWDFSQASDIMVDGGGVTHNVYKPGAPGDRDKIRHDGDGTVVWHTEAGPETPQGINWYVTLMMMAWPHDGPDAGALPDDRDGVTNPLDANRYNQLSMRVYATKATKVWLRWFGCREYTSHCSGLMEMSLDRGWNTIIRPITKNYGGGQAWQGDVYGLRLEGLESVTSGIRLDWVRVFEPGDTVTIPGVCGPVYDRDENPNNNQDWVETGQPAWGELSGNGTCVLEFPVGAFPPATYYIHDDSSYTEEAIRIRPRPRPVILDPDRAGGEDYATAVLGNPWDFDDASDVRSIHNTVNASFSGGVFSGTNAPGSNDPYVMLPLGPHGLDPVHYHRVSVRTWYDGPFNLDDSVGGGLGGTHGRLIWRGGHHPRTGHAQYSDGREFVFFTDRKTYVYDMADVSDDPEFGSTAEPNVHQDGTPFSAPDPTWTKGTIGLLRFDPNEAPSQYRWHLDELRIAADDAAEPTFDITWVNGAWESGTNATIRLDTDQSGYDGEVLGTVDEAKGTNTFRFDATGRLPGTYWVNITSTTSDGRTGRAYSTGPLQISPRAYGKDRVGTAIELSRQAFRGGADAAVVASSLDFPDALAATQLADAIGGPLLLTPPNALPSAVGKELQRLGVGQVFLAGGSAAVSGAVADTLDDVVAKVTRIGGKDRYDTSRLLAAEAARRRGGADEVVLAVGTAFPDALAAGPYVGRADVPLVLTHGSTATDATAAALRDLDPDRVLVAGGSAAISDDVLQELLPGTPWTRVAGADRFETAVKLAQQAIAAGASRDDVIVATGLDFPDALAAGPAAIAANGTLVLAARDRVPESTRDYLRDHRGSWRSWKVAGGRAAIDHATVRALRSYSNL